MRNAAAFTPTMLVGAYCGIWAAKHLGEKLFRTLAMAAVAVMGIVLLGSSIHGLL